MALPPVITGGPPSIDDLAPRREEEDASFASLAASRALEVARDYRQLIACELLAAVRALRLQPSRAPTGRVGDLVEAAAELPRGTADRDLTGDLAVAVDLVPALAALVAAPATDCFRALSY
jgi:histidine ammonia-lyase